MWMFHGSQPSHRKKEQDVCLECGGSGTKTMAFASTRRFGPDWEVIDTWGGVEFWHWKRCVWSLEILTFLLFLNYTYLFLFQINIWELNGKILFVMCIRLSCALTELVWWFHCNFLQTKDMECVVDDFQTVQCLHFNFWMSSGMLICINVSTEPQNISIVGK